MGNSSMAIGGILTTTTTTNIKIFSGADNSLAIGNRVNVNAPQIFAWSDWREDDYDSSDPSALFPTYFTGSQPNTSIARSYNGFAINKIQPTKQ